MTNLKKLEHRYSVKLQKLYTNIIRLVHKHVQHKHDALYRLGKFENFRMPICCRYIITKHVLYVCFIMINGLFV